MSTQSKWRPRRICEGTYVKRQVEDIVEAQVAGRARPRIVARVLACGGVVEQATDACRRCGRTVDAVRAERRGGRA